MKRLVWIDDAKAIGIFLVILAHTQIMSNVVDWISVFRMPLFFFLSGCLFSFQRNPDFLLFFKKRFRQIVIPYILINLITYLFWLLVSRHYGISSAEEIVPWYSPLKAILLCNGKEMIHNIPLWFLLCLFLVEIIYYVVYKSLFKWQKWTVTFLFCILGYINYKYVPFVLPFSLGTAFVGIVFYDLGNEFINYIKTFSLPLSLKFIVLIISVILVTYFSITNSRVYLYCNQYGNYISFLFAALCGICMMYIFTNILSKWLGPNRIIEYISRNTLTICGFHLMTYTLLKGIATYIIGIPLESFSGAVLLNVLLAVIGMFICCMIAYLLNKYFPIILGK